MRPYGRTSSAIPGKTDERTEQDVYPGVFLLTAYLSKISSKRKVDEIKNITIRGYGVFSIGIISPNSYDVNNENST